MTLISLLLAAVLFATSPAGALEAFPESDFMGAWMEARAYCAEDEAFFLADSEGDAKDAAATHIEWCQSLVSIERNISAAGYRWNPEADTWEAD
jgi:hypothetical protein